MTSALLNCCWVAVLITKVRVITLQACWDGQKEDLLGSCVYSCDLKSSEELGRGCLQKCGS